MDKTEKYLKSIDNTLSEILKELKRQGRPSLLTEKGQIESIINEVRKGSISLDSGPTNARSLSSEYL